MQNDHTVTMGRLAGQTVLVTGAARGLGAVFARAVAEEHGSVLALGRDANAINALLASLPAAKGVIHKNIIVDVTNAKMVKKLLEGQLFNALINNAGIAMSEPLHSSNKQRTRKLIDTNLLGSLWVLQASIPCLERAGGGVVVNIASTLGHRPLPHAGIYAASKAAVFQLTRPAALELAHRKIRVNALAPGYVKTDLNKALLESPAGEKLKQLTALRRFADAHELIPPLMLLLDPENSYMTGAILTVDGGMSSSI